MKPTNRPKCYQMETCLNTPGEKTNMRIMFVLMPLVNSNGHLKQNL